MQSVEKNSALPNGSSINSKDYAYVKTLFFKKGNRKNSPKESDIPYILQEVEALLIGSSGDAPHFIFLTDNEDGKVFSSEKTLPEQGKDYWQEKEYKDSIGGIYGAFEPPYTPEKIINIRGLVGSIKYNKIDHIMRSILNFKGLVVKAVSLSDKRSLLTAPVNEVKFETKEYNTELVDFDSSLPSMKLEAVDGIENKSDDATPPMDTAVLLA